MERHISDVQLVLAGPQSTFRASLPDGCGRLRQPERRSRPSMTSASARASPPLQTSAERHHVRTAGDTAAPDEHRQIRAGRLHGAHDRPQRAVMISRGHRHRNREWARGLSDRSSERIGRDIGAKVDDVVPAAAQHVGGHGGGQPVELARRRAEDDAPLARAPFREAGAEAGHQPRRHSRGPVLVVNRVLAGLPACADRAHGLAQLIEDDVVGRGPSAQARLDDRPCPRFVPGHEPALESLRRDPPGGLPCHRPRPASDRLLPGCATQVPGVHPPL